MMDKALRIRAMMDKYGFESAESICNEWNYVKGWTEEVVYTIKAIHGIRGAMFTLGCICAAQNHPIDMLMYYDTRPSVFCGAFDYYTYDPLKGYYPLYWYGKFYDMEKAIQPENRLANIYSLCGVDADGKVMAILTHYSDDDNADAKSVALDFGRNGRYEVYLLDETHDGELIQTTDQLEFCLANQSVLLVKEI
jgi:hypothetical protein